MASRVVPFAELARCPLRNTDLTEYCARLNAGATWARKGQNVELYTDAPLGDAHAAYLRELYWLNRRVLERAQMPTYSAFDLKHQASTCEVRGKYAHFREEPDGL